MIPKDSSCPAILGFRVSISRGPYHEHNCEIKFAEPIACFFPMRKYIQATAALPISQASRRIHSNNTGKVSKIQCSPCFSSFLPPNRCCRPGEEAHRVTLTPLMVFLGGDKFFWVPSIIAPSSLRQLLTAFRRWGPPLKEWRRLLPSNPAYKPRGDAFRRHGAAEGGRRPAIHPAASSTEGPGPPSQ